MMMRLLDIIRILATWLVVIDVFAMGEIDDGCLTSELNGRMGNLMFQHASIIGICTARGLDYKKCAYLSNSGWNTWDLPIKEFIQTFHLPQDNAATCKIGRGMFYREKSFEYDPHFMEVPLGTTVRGWMQSWRYFHPHAEKIIRQLYTVPEAPSRTAAAFISNIRRLVPHNYKLIGVHVRLGDKLGNPQNAHFYDQWALSEDYYRKAVRLLTARHPHSALVFFSGGGENKNAMNRDREWTRARFGSISNNTFFDHSEDHFVALKALSMCDSIVVAHSTFSWWAGYLSDTLEVVAPYHLFSAAAGEKEGYRMEDYYPPWWSVISNNTAEDRVVGFNPLR